LHTYRAKTNSKDLKVMLRDEKSQEVHFYELRKEKPCPLIFIMIVSNYVNDVLSIGVMLLVFTKRKK